MRQIILIFCLLCALSVRAQFFFDFPSQKVEQPSEKYTPPSYKKGKSAMETFMLQNFRQPTERERVDGRIVVAVIVDAKGKPVETHIVRSLTKALDEEELLETEIPLDEMSGVFALDEPALYRKPDAS